jgi:hypothetical protein
MNAAPQPSRFDTVRAINVVSDALGERYCWRVGERFFFPLDVERGWFVALSPDSARRFRLEACRGTRPVARLWTHALDFDRLAGLVQELNAELAALAA